MKKNSKTTTKYKICQAVERSLLEVLNLILKLTFTFLKVKDLFSVLIVKYCANMTLYDLFENGALKHLQGDAIRFDDGTIRQSINYENLLNLVYTVIFLYF